ncbi:1,4-alpha-glucan branching protein GlgB [Shewanella avicenniae]|uniref:1,4-alpha-glucan branching enzyme GlgB n=2 Tax=Shewanella avicenniae TaxID=2814294 RepID=A0ABX7QY18_9GAMM|nr:1,4-alpha-glucan branching protein GlgB [Shewanella avicenniae]
MSETVSENVVSATSTSNAPDNICPEYGCARALANGSHGDPFSWLGMHLVDAEKKALVVRAVLPGALKVDVLDEKTGKKVASLDPVSGAEPLFVGKMGRRVKPFPYLLQVTYPAAEHTLRDPYAYGSQLNDDDVYLFNEGRQQQAWQFLGANWHQVEDVNGVLFCVWAPNAQSVSLIADFNYWDKRRHSMRKHPASGIWDIFIPELQGLEHYKFAIQTVGGWHEKADPFARAMEPPPHNASIVPVHESWKWRDSQWMKKRAKTVWHQAPVSIYEVHLGSWRRKGADGREYINYQDAVSHLIPYVKEMGFTHVEFMPLSEYPFDGSWGYQPVGMYAPTYRFGDAAGLKMMIDEFHQAGIGVILDWVPAHFPKDPHGLGNFDGTCLYEHQDPRRGSHPDWDTLIYNYGRKEVQTFLLSNACYWLQEFHIDGLRLDAVSSMLYLDYSRKAGEWTPNQFGGRENIEAIDFLKDLNTRLYASYPGIMMIAEESTAWGGVSRDVSGGGLGFGFKWNMGWMHDTLCYLGRDPVHRSYHHHEMTFSMVYAYTEQFILSLSHDEVVHGKRALIEKIPGDDWQKFATLRAYYGFMWAHPGKKLIFMGDEFGQRREWQHDFSLDWHLLQYAPHSQLKQWVADLNKLYVEQPALWLQDMDGSGFAWLDCTDAASSVLAFCRFDGKGKAVVVVSNFTPTVREGYRVGLPHWGQYRESLNSDSAYYGGSNVGNGGVIHSEEQPWQGMSHSAVITLPPLSTVYFTLESE